MSDYESDFEEDIELQSLGVKCTSTDCANGLHCFLQKKRGKTPIRHGGPCRDCGKDLVEWDRVNARELEDAAYTFASLRNEMIRHVFWHSSFTVREWNYAKRKGRILLRVAARRRVEVSVGRAMHPMEGRQTPFQGNILYHAQHAVAACCRKCIEYWHGIPAGRALTPEEVSYLVELIMLYVADRLPDLSDEPTKVPPIRSRSTSRPKT